MTRIGAAARGATMAAARVRTATPQGVIPILLSAHSEQHFDRQLIEPLVAEAAWPSGAELRDQRLNLGVSVPLPGALFQDEVGPHASAGEIADTVVIFGPVGMRVEMARAGVADVLQELHQPEGRLHVGRSQTEILFVSSRNLLLQCD